MYNTDGGQICSEYFVPSYTPTLGALLKARRDFQAVRRSEARMVLAAVPKPFKMTPLPFATDEINSIKAVVPRHCLVATFEDVGIISSASAHEILASLPGASFLHLACHGYQDASSPLDSGFVMRDKMLTLSDIMSLKLPHAFFAFLSACETAKGDNVQPDQAVHLAAAMLFAGFNSVVGTMWLVPSFQCLRTSLSRRQRYLQVHGRC